MTAENPLVRYLEGKSKRAFAGACGLISTDLYKYLPGRDGRPPKRKIGANLARRMVEASGGELDYWALRGLAPPAKQAA